jgi:CBS domain-containing protein
VTVGDTMRRATVTCPPDATLEQAGQQMERGNLALLAVVSGAGRLLGVITDHAVATALASANRRPSEVAVRDVMAVEPETRQASDSLESALALMRNLRSRHVLVADRAGRLEGLLSLDDVIASTWPTKDNADQEEAAVLETLRALR